MPNLYLGQWEWISGGAGTRSHWRAPGGDAVGVLDLRKPSESALAGPLPQGHALFVYSAPKVDPLLVRSLGDDIEGNLNLAQRTALETSLGLLPGAIVETRLLDVIRELLLSHSDPTGVNKWKPLLGNIFDGVQCHLGGWGRLLRENLTNSHPAYNKTIEVFRTDYRRNKANGVNLSSLRKWTGSTMLRLLGRMSDSDAAGILPVEHVSDGWLPPDTTITESFNKADSDILGPDLTWTEFLGDIDVVSNAAERPAAGSGIARADTDLSSADHSSKAAIVASIPAVGSYAVICRKDGTATETFYYANLNVGEAPDQWTTWKAVAGTYTQLGTLTAVNVVANDTIKVDANGSTVTRYRNDVSQEANTDTDVTGNLRCGIFLTEAGVRFDSFEAADLAAAGPSEAAQRRNTIWGYEEGVYG